MFYIDHRLRSYALVLSESRRWPKYDRRRQAEQALKSANAPRAAGRQACRRMNGGDGWTASAGPTQAAPPAIPLVYLLEARWWGGTSTAFTLPITEPPLVCMLEVGWWGSSSGEGGSSASAAEPRTTLPPGLSSGTGWLSWLFLGRGSGWLSWLFLGGRGKIPDANSATEGRGSRPRPPAKHGPSARARTTSRIDGAAARLPRHPSLTKLQPLHGSSSAGTAQQPAAPQSEVAVPGAKPSRFQERRQAWRQR